jgi:hypothetical protein
MQLSSQSSNSRWSDTIIGLKCKLPKRIQEAPSLHKYMYDIYSRIMVITLSEFYCFGHLIKMGNNTFKY